MCARFSLTGPVENLRKLFGFAQSPNIRARYNIAPTQEIWAIRNCINPDYPTELFSARWGLVPSWSKTSGNAARLINARSETVSEKPSFRSAYKSRRCLIPANSFFEWQKIGKSGKQPWRVGLKNWEIFTFAGLWENWKSPEGEQIKTCTILTTVANDEMSYIHDRMPVIIAPKDHQKWLSGQDDKTLFIPCAANDMIWYRVDKKVGNVRNDSPDLIEKLCATPSLL